MPVAINVTPVAPIDNIPVAEKLTPLTTGVDKLKFPGEVTVKFTDAVLFEERAKPDM